ncbi:oxygenase MpaB family protein, partial [Streptomyces afghaniensis]|uniref:oxygenase MpaB family protein n=1 Tax=Streptomyces afghaniensis TaxID=66865 RepID=UPI0031453137
HASIRHHLERENRWDTTALGTPICQEDMIGGQMFFSLLVLDSLHRLGIHMSQEGAEAYYYAWRVVGAMLGVDQDAVPKTLEEARAFLDLYMIRHMGALRGGPAPHPAAHRPLRGGRARVLLDPIVSA